jgi:hypothetical protein
MSYDYRDYKRVDPALLERILIYLEHFDDDNDYRGDSWKSEQLKRDINELIDILGLPEERKR